MMDDMGMFRTTISIESIEKPGMTVVLHDVLVDTGSELTWAPRVALASLGITPRRRQRFIVADGRTIERDVGFAIVHAGGTNAPELVVFAEAGDMVLLGAHALEGLNLRIDPVRKELTPAGPIITAVAA
jgi:predicted aspartyl protease